MIRVEYDLTAVVRRETEMTEEEVAALLLPPTADDLRAYANTLQWRLVTGGYTVTIGGTPRTFPTDDTGRSLLSGAVVRLQQGDAPTTIKWQFADEFVALSAGDVIGAGIAVSDFVQATFDALADVVGAIDAGAVITTGEIDDWSWPDNRRAGE